jgi:hypothetical protein
MYDNGEGVTQDFAEALSWYKQAAEQGHVEAQCNLGKRYYKGEGVTQDFAEALSWYKQAAEQGDADAQFRVGRIYAYEEGVLQDSVEALSWYKKAAEQGHAKALFGVGSMYQSKFDENPSLRPEDAEALVWYKKAAEQGYVRAQLHVGYLCSSGHIVPHDTVEAFTWYKKAAEQGDAHAQCVVGNLYAIGQGVAQDWIEAASWYSKADKQGFTQDEDGFPSLFTELISRHEIDLPVIEAMLKKGANPNLQASDGNTAFHYFCLNYLPHFKELPEKIRYCRSFLLAGGLVGLANDKGEMVKTLLASEGVELDALYQKRVTSLLDWRSGLFYQATAKAFNTDMCIETTLKRARDAEQTPCLEESENKKIKLGN